MATTLRKLVTTWGFDVDDSALQKMQQDQEKLRTGFIKLGAVATAALAAVVVPAAGLQAAIKDTLTLSDESGQAFIDLEKTLTDSALRVSSKLGIAAKDVATGFYQVISTGAVAGSEQFDALSETALKMAKTVGLEPSAAIERLADTVNSFKLEGTEAGRVADILFKTSKLAATTVPQLTEAMAIAAPAAVAFGTDIETTAANLATLAQAGIKGQRAGTGLQAIFLRLQKPTTEISNALKFLGVEIIDKATGNFKNFNQILLEMRGTTDKLTQAKRGEILATIAGQEHAKSLLNLIGAQTDTTITWTKELAEAEGALDRAFTIKMGSAIEQAKLFWIRLKNLAIVIGGPLVESITPAVKGIAEFTVGVSEYLKQHPEFVRFVATWGGLTLAVLALGSAIGIAATSLKLFAITAALAGGALTASFFWAIGLAAMLVVLAGVIYKNKEAIEEWWNFNKGVDIDQFLAEIVGWITQVDTLATSYGNLKQKIKELYDWLPSLPSISDLLPEWFGGFRRGLRERGAPEQIFGMTTEIAQPRGGLLAGGIQRTNNMDVTFNIMSQTGDPNSIAAEVTNRLGEYLRSTAAEMGQ